MPNSALFALLLAAGALTPGAALGQRPVELAMRGGPQPHFVAAWAPEREREAERSAVLAGRVSLELANVSLDEALKTLTNEAGLNITYSPTVLPAGKRVTIKAGDIAVITALTEMLFRSGLDVVVDQDGTLALVRCKHVAPRAEIQDSGTIVGTVTDKATGSPLAGATVVVEGTKRSTTTDTDGRYRISGVSPGTYTLRARYIGYAALSTSLTVGAGQEVTADFGLARSTQKLDELVTVTPGGMQSQVKALPTPVSVITADEIEQQHSRNTQQIIRQAVPTAISWDVPASPGFTSFSARGATTLNGNSPMKVFIDGIEVSDFLFAPVDPNSIERIEVIRGPQAAAVYGSDANGGVVQIYTKRGNDTRPGPLVKAEAEVGVLQTPYDGFGSVLRQNYNASIRGGTSNTSYNFGAGYSHSDDYLPRDEISRQSAPSAYGGVQYSSGNFAADVFGRYFINKAPDVFNPLMAQTGFFFFTQPNFQPTETSNQTLGARLTLAPTRSWRNVLKVGLDRTVIDRVQTRPRLTTPSDTLLSVFNSQVTKRSVGFSSLVEGAIGSKVAGSISVGFDHYSLPATSFSAFSTASTTGVIDNAGLPAFLARNVINNTGYFAQGELGFRDALFLTAGIRAEDNSEFGDSIGTPISPRVGVSVVQEFGATTLKLRGSYGRGIRPPAPGQKTSNVTSFQVQLPNPLLGPERQHGWDAGVDAVFGGRGSMSVTWYDQRATNLIEFVQLSPTPVPTFQFQNVARVKNTGLEVEGRLSFGRLQLNGQYGYTRSRVDELGPSYAGDLRVGEQALLTPKHTAGGGFSLAVLPTTTLTGGITYVGSWRAFDNIALFSCFGGTGPCRPSNRDYIIDYPGFAKINASISHSFTATVTAILSVENLTNNEAYEVGNTQPVFGRTTTLGLRFDQ